MLDEPEFLCRLRNAYAYLLLKGRYSEAKAVNDCIETFIVAWEAGNVRMSTDGRYMWGVEFVPASPGV